MKIRVRGFQAEAKALRQDVLEERKGDQHAWRPVIGGRDWSASVRGEKGYGGQSWPEGPERTDAGLGCLRRQATDLLVRQQCDLHYV